MLDHPAIDVALGLIFFFVVLSLVTSAVQEWIASLFALRSKNLNEGIRNLVGNEYAKRVYEHPLIKNLAKEGKLPSYIAPQTFSEVLLEILAKDNANKSYVACTAEEARDIVSKIDADHPLRRILEALIDNGEDAANGLKDKLAGWFDEGMSRIAGWYKRKVQWIIFLIAAGVVIATNASSVHIAEELWRNDGLRASIAAQAQAAGEQEALPQLEAGNLEALESFPIGWDSLPSGPVDWLKSFLGWLITIAAISLGAPFWFDLLGKVANLRAAGGKSDNSSSPKPTA